MSIPSRSEAASTAARYGLGHRDAAGHSRGLAGQRSPHFGCKCSESDLRDAISLAVHWRGCKKGWTRVASRTSHCFCSGTCVAARATRAMLACARPFLCRLSDRLETTRVRENFTRSGEKTVKRLNLQQRIAILCLRCAPGFAGAGSYDVTDIGSLGGTSTYGSAMNAVGLVAGSSLLSGNAIVHAVLWNGSSMQDLGSLGGTYSEGRAINASGWITGYSQLAGNLESHAFLWNGNSMQDLGALGANNSYGLAINPSGWVAGWRPDAKLRLSRHPLERQRRSGPGRAWQRRQHRVGHQRQRVGRRLVLRTRQRDSPCRDLEWREHARPWNAWGHHELCGRHQRNGWAGGCSDDHWGRRAACLCPGWHQTRQTSIPPCLRAIRSSCGKPLRSTTPVRSWPTHWTLRLGKVAPSFFSPALQFPFGGFFPPLATRRRPTA